MKILAFSDVHADADAIDELAKASVEVDVVVAAGDLGIEQRFLEETIEYLSAIETPTIVVPGNHDDFEALTAACANWKSAHVLHGSGVEIGNIHFFGLGYETPRICTESWSRHLSDAQAEEALKNAPPGCVLVTHTPPYGVGDLQPTGTHEGSPAIAAFVSDRQPKLHLCGHIHHSWGARGTIGDTVIANLGPAANWFTVPD